MWRSSRTSRAGAWGTGRVHHVAWRVDDDAAELAARKRLHDVGTQTTEVIDRFWFKSVYFSEPGGALFELATDGPGFGIDETAETLGDAADSSAVARAAPRGDRARAADARDA